VIPGSPGLALAAGGHRRKWREDPARDLASPLLAVVDDHLIGGRRQFELSSATILSG
jgi:hypothetical protein